MACSTGHFPLQCECCILVPRLGKKQHLSAGNFLRVRNGWRISAPVKEQLAPVKQQLSAGNFLRVRNGWRISAPVKEQLAPVTQELSAGNFLRVRNGWRISSPVKEQLAPVLLENVVGRVRASSGQEHKSNQNVDELGGNLDCGRRAMVTGLIGALFFSFGTDALAADTSGMLSKYIKRKKLDPLETYVPTILLAQSQFQEVDGKLDGEASKFKDARSLLRNGPAASLRTDIRAVAQYAAESGNDGGASAAVDQCLSALEDLDGLLLQASRSQGAPIEKMRQRLATAVTALDRLLDTVPGSILEKGKAVAKAYRDSD